jgi:hypothetical protein
MARTAVFSRSELDSRADVSYRVVYPWQGRSDEWSGTIRRDPADRPVLTVAAFSCGHRHRLPATPHGP